MARRYRRWPAASYAVFAILALLIALRAGWDALEPPAPPDAPHETASAGSATLAAGPCEVVRVVDGDTLIVRQTAVAAGPDKPEQFRVRLLGVDTPETVKEDTAVEAWGPEATAFTREFVRRGEARLEFDKRRVDRFGRYLAYLYVGEEMLNVELVRSGLARVSHYSGDSQAVLRLLRAAEREARDARRGIWGVEERATSSGR